MLPGLANHTQPTSVPATPDRRSPGYIRWLQQALNQASGAAQPPQIGTISLACHSGGG
jgi:hypothetical protein